MKKLKWIRSTGGPLICVECKLEKYWRGIDQGEGANSISDYARACGVKGYLGKIKIKHGFALILGDMPVDTTAWVSGPNSIFILKLIFIEPDADIRGLLKHAENANFGTPAEVSEFEIGSGWVAIFDSSLAGLGCPEERIVLNTAVGRYQVLTAALQPDRNTTAIVHKLSHVGEARANAEWSRT